MSTMIKKGVGESSAVHDKEQMVMVLLHEYSNVMPFTNAASHLLAYFQERKKVWTTDFKYKIKKWRRKPSCINS